MAARRGKRVDRLRHGVLRAGVTLGMMDSGYRTTHEAFQTDLIESVRAEGVYGTSGFGYRGATPTNPFTAGEWFTVAGDQARTSDYSHGTGMLEVTSGMRDGKDQHGIAFGSKMHVAKTGGSDTQSHGPFHDYVYGIRPIRPWSTQAPRSSTAVGALSSRLSQQNPL